MLYDITVTLDLGFHQPSDHVRNLLRLLPADLPGQQRRVTASIRAEPAPDERGDRTDFFGTTVTEMAWHRPVEGLSLRLEARVDRNATSPRLDLSPPLARLGRDLAAASPMGPDSPHHFLGASDRVLPLPAMTDYARNAIAEAGAETALCAMRAIGEALHRDMRFDADATDVDTPTLEAFEARHGVCQDFSHVMIACLRGVGLPAAYVSGYLRTLPPEGMARLEGADAMHAWVQAWCGQDLGWIAFDPTNDMIAAADHIIVGYGRDYSDMAPIRGAHRSSGAQASHMRVDVSPV
jgi:transglutaminase-like putative cysteine protease